MDTIITILIIAISPFIGLLIRNFSKEEMKIGKRWLNLLKDVLFVIAVFVFMLAFKFQLWYVIGSALILAIYLFYKEFRNQNLSWLLFAIMFAMLANLPLVLVFASLLFLYGLPAGSLQHPFWQSMIFFVVSLGLVVL